MGYYRTVEANVEAAMDRTPAPISLATARGLLLHRFGSAWGSTLTVLA